MVSQRQHSDKIGMRFDPPPPFPSQKLVPPIKRTCAVPVRLV